MTDFIDSRCTKLSLPHSPGVRGDGGRSRSPPRSLGGLVASGASVRSRIPTRTRSLSGAFWQSRIRHTRLRDETRSSARDVAIYSTTVATRPTNSEWRGRLDRGPRHALSPWLAAVRFAEVRRVRNALCYDLAPGANQRELSWISGVWRFVRFMFPPDRGPQPKGWGTCRRLKADSRGDVN